MKEMHPCECAMHALFVDQKAGKAKKGLAGGGAYQRKIRIAVVPPFLSSAVLEVSLPVQLLVGDIQNWIPPPSPA